MCAHVQCARAPDTSPDLAGPALTWPRTNSVRSRVSNHAVYGCSLSFIQGLPTNLYRASASLASCRASRPSASYLVPENDRCMLIENLRSLCVERASERARCPLLAEALQKNAWARGAGGAGWAWWGPWGSDGSLRVPTACAGPIGWVARDAARRRAAVSSAHARGVEC